MRRRSFESASLGALAACLLIALLTSRGAGGEESISSQEVEQLRADLSRQVERFSANGASFEVWLSGNVFESLVGEINQLPPDQRNLRYQSTRRHGYLDRRRQRGFDTGWFVELDDHDDFTASAQIESMVPRWTPEGRLAIALDLDVAARARVHWHVEPPVGGGAGDRATISATTSQTLQLIADLTSDGQDFIYTLDLVSPRKVPVRVETRVDVIGTIGISENVDLPVGRLASGPLPDLLTHQGRLEAGAPFDLKKTYDLMLRPLPLVKNGDGVSLRFDASLTFSE